MRHLHIFLSLATLAKCDWTSNGWSINCKVDTDQKYGPAFLAKNQQKYDQLSLYWSYFGTLTAGIAAASPFSLPGNETPCSSTNNQTEIVVKADFITWPNEVGQVPEEVFGPGFIHIPTGFATPTTYDGCVAIANMNLRDGSQYPVGSDEIQIITGGCGTGSRQDTPYFYHYVKWFDMDGDGNLDLVTARASGKFNPTDLDSSDLVWLKNPGNAHFTPGNSQWETFVISAAHDIADTYFDVVKHPETGNIIVVVGGFASQTLAVFQSQNWTDVESILTDVYNKQGGNYFTQKFSDLDRDGIPDVIITIGSYSVQNGQLIVYKGGFDQNGHYYLSQMTVIYDQFPVWSSPAVGSPGEAIPFWRTTYGEESGQRPSILISGDDDGAMYIATPNDESSFGSYDLETIYSSSPFIPNETPLNAPTVGSPAVADLNENGCNEIVVANYHNKQLVVIEQDICN